MKNIVRAMADEGAILSLSQGRRIVTMRGVRVNGDVVDDISADVADGDVIRIGKEQEITVGKDSRTDRRTRLDGSVGPEARGDTSSS